MTKRTFGRRMNGSTKSNARNRRFHSILKIAPDALDAKDGRAAHPCIAMFPMKATMKKTHGRQFHRLRYTVHAAQPASSRVRIAPATLSTIESGRHCTTGTERRPARPLANLRC